MIGREEQLTTLNTHYNSERNNLTILYGRTGIGKTTLIKEFLKDKEYAYFEAGIGTDFELLSGFGRCLGVNDPADYDEVFASLIARGIRIFVIEEFQNLARVDATFMSAVAYLMKNSPEKIMMICSCSSISWVENSMVRTIGTAAFSINTFMKLKEFSYLDMVNLFPNCEAGTVLSIFAVTGGVPGYVARWDVTRSVKENICQLMLAENGFLTEEVRRYLSEEFRETGVYNTILYCLATGRNKLNDIHEYTGYGRDKISVYLKNLIEREIVEKVFSYDIGGNEHTKKGLYRVREGFLRFYFGYVYPYAGVRAITAPEEFYDRYIAADFAACRLEAYIVVASEFVGIMNNMGRLPGNFVRKGSWYGKKGDIHLIFESEKGESLVGEVYVKDSPVTQADLDEVMTNVTLSGIPCERFYLFSAAGFAQELLVKQSEQLVLVDITDL